MSANHPEKPVIGDDGELLQADKNVDLAVYSNYVRGLMEIAIPARSRAGGTSFVRIPFGCAVIVLLACTFVFVIGQTLPGGVSGSVTPVPSFLLPESGKFVISPIAQWQGVKNVAWSPDSNKLAVQSNSDEVFIWNFQELLRLSPLSYKATAIGWSPDGKRLALDFYGETNVYTVGGWVSRLVKRGMTWGRTARLVWSPHGSMIALLEENGTRVVVLDAKYSDVLHSQEFTAPLTDLDWTPNSYILNERSAAGLWKWHLGSKAEIIQSAPQTDQFGSPYVQVALSPDEWRIAVVSDGLAADPPYIGVAIGWLSEEQFALEKTIRVQSSVENPRFDLRWSPDSSRLALFSNAAPEVYTWNVQASEIIEQSFDPEGAEITCMDWSYDSHYLAVGTTSSLTIWSPVYTSPTPF